MHRPLSGVKVIEVAQFTFTPAAGAVLTEWGAEVIKVEPAETGDSQRGMVSQPSDGAWFPVIEHPNRGKHSIGLALNTPEGRQVLLDLCRDADVFLTNYLPAARKKLKIDVDDIRAANPSIIFVRGSAHGVRGPWAERGGFDGTSFWCRMGSAWGTTEPGADQLQHMPAGAYGDSLGGMAIAGGIAAAIAGRERSGETSIVDVSLMSTGAWAFGLAIANSDILGESQPGPVLDGSVNPLASCLKTSDGRWINLTAMQPTKFFADFCLRIGLDDLAADERLQTFQGIMAHAKEITERFRVAIAAKPYAYWVEKLDTWAGQWAPVQSPFEILSDPQMTANGYLVEVTDTEGKSRKLVTNPVQFDETPPDVVRAPTFAEHTDDLLTWLGRTEEQILDLKIAGAVT